MMRGKSGTLNQVQHRRFSQGYFRLGPLSCDMYNLASCRVTEIPIISTWFLCECTKNF